MKHQGFKNYKKYRRFRCGNVKCSSLDESGGSLKELKVPEKVSDFCLVRSVLFPFALSFDFFYSSTGNMEKGLAQRYQMIREVSSTIHCIQYKSCASLSLIPLCFVVFCIACGSPSGCCSFLRFNKPNRRPLVI